MRGTGLVFLCLLLVRAIDVQAGPPTKPSTKSPQSFCRAPETALFDCDAKETFVSVCQSGPKVAFRFGIGSWATPDLESVSNGHDGIAHRLFAPMGSSGAQEHSMRFSWHGIDFITFFLDWSQAHRDSGLAIEKDHVLLARTTCRKAVHPAFEGPSFVANETDEKYQGIY
jgi:hypothetical protein